MSVSDVTESTSSPKIIRSFISQKSYGYERDSTQLSQYIRRIFQDSKGNLWFGTTDDGVIRYDGKSLTYFTTREGFGGNCVTGMMEDKNGMIWFSSIGGVTAYSHGKFINYTMKDGLAANDVWSILEDQNGTIWVGTSAGVCFLEGKKFKSFALPRSEIRNSPSEVSSKLARCIFEDKEGNIWFGMDGHGVYKYDPTPPLSTKDKTFTQFTRKSGLCSNNVTSILQDKQGMIWFSFRWNDGDGGICSFDGNEFTPYTKKDGLNSNQVWSLYEDKNGTLWMANDGVNKFDGTSFTGLHIKDGLTNTSVQSILEDKKENIWIGTGAGLFIYNGYSIENVRLNGPWPKEFH